MHYVAIFLLFTMNMTLYLDLKGDGFLKPKEKN